jgi:hypothetical protein
MSNKPKPIARQLQALWKYHYLARPETKNIHNLVLRLRDGKWVDKEVMLEIIQQYVIHCEEMMKRYMNISILTNSSAEVHRVLYEHQQAVTKMEDAELDKQIAALEEELRKEGKLP